MPEWRQKITCKTCITWTDHVSFCTWCPSTQHSIARCSSMTLSPSILFSFLTCCPKTCCLSCSCWWMSVLACLYAATADAWVRLCKHAPQTGVVHAASKPMAEPVLSSSSVCAVSVLTSRSLRASAPEYPFFTLITGPLFWEAASA